MHARRGGTGLALGLERDGTRTGAADRRRPDSAGDDPRGDSHGARSTVPLARPPRLARRADHPPRSHRRPGRMAVDLHPEGPVGAVQPESNARETARYVSVVIEAAVESLDAAHAAARGGADRLELCANLDVGGTTPSTA